MRITEIVFELNGALPKRSPVRVWRRDAGEIQVAFGGNDNMLFKMPAGLVDEDREVLEWAKRVVLVGTGRDWRETNTKNDLREIADELLGLVL